MCTSVQASEQFEYNLSDFHCVAQDYQVARVLKDPANAGRRGNFPRKSLIVHIVHNTRTRMLSQITDQEEINRYTYGLFYAETKEGYETQLRKLSKPSSASVNISLDGKEKQVSIDLEDDLAYQAKFMILKHFTEGIDFNSINIDKTDVPQERIDNVVAQFQTAKADALKNYEAKKAELTAKLQHVVDSGLEVTGHKYYGQCTDIEFRKQQSAYINRFLPKAVDI